MNIDETNIQEISKQTGLEMRHNSDDMYSLYLENAIVPSLIWNPKWYHVKIFRQASVIDRMVYVSDVVFVSQEEELEKEITNLCKLNKEVKAKLKLNIINEDFK